MEPLDVNKPKPSPPQVARAHARSLTRTHTHSLFDFSTVRASIYSDSAIDAFNSGPAIFRTLFAGISLVLFFYYCNYYSIHFNLHFAKQTKQLLSLLLWPLSLRDYVEL